MHYVLGIILRDSDIEILEDERKGSYMGLIGVKAEANARMKQSPNIKQINIYSMKQGQRILADRVY